MKSLQKLLGAFLVLIALNCVSVAYAVSEVDSGTCGENLTWVLTEDGILTISGEGAMEDYTRDENPPWDWDEAPPWVEYSETIFAVVFEEGVTSIGDYALYEFRNLEGITLADSVTHIGDYAFSGCFNLREITLPENLESIGCEAFAFCAEVAELHIPANVKNIGELAFRNFLGLKSFTVSEDNAYYSAADFVLYNKEQTTLIYYLGGAEEYVIPEGVTTIANHAFFNNNVLRSIVISDGVEYIGEFAFQSCGSLTTVEIPPSVTTIDANAFRDCDALEQIIFHEGLNYIGNLAFCSCDTLREVWLPSTLIEIGEYAFADCIALEVVEIDHGVQKIGKEAFRNCVSLVYVNLPESVESIGDNAFYDCDRLTKIVIPNSVISMGDSVFFNCDNLETVILEEGLTVVGNHAFFDCNNLVEVTIPNSITVMGDSAFSECDNLRTVILEEGLTVLGDNAFYDCDNLVVVTVPNSITFMGDWVFSNCDNLETVILEEGLTVLGNNVFTNSPNLTTVEIPGSIGEMGGAVFSHCDSLVSAVIGDGLTAIPAALFYDCDALSIVCIPNTVLTIGEDAFANCYSFATVEYAGTQNQWNAIEIAAGNDPLLNAEIIFNSTDEPEIPNDDAEILAQAEEAGLLKYLAVSDLQANLTRLDTVKLLVAMLELKPVSGATVPFADCDALTQEEKELVAVLVDAGIIKGTGPDTFAPYDQLTYGQLAAMLCRALGESDELLVGPEWMVNATKILVNRGILKGEDNLSMGEPAQAGGALTLMIRTKEVLNAEEDAALLAQAEEAGLLKYLTISDLQANLTRLDTVKLLAAMLELEPVSGATVSFADCDALTQQEKELVAALVDAGIIKGTGPDTFAPYDQLTYGQLAAMLCRALGESDELLVGPEWMVNATKILVNRGILKGEDNLSMGEPAQAGGALTLMIRTKAILEEDSDEPELPEGVIAMGKCGENLTWTLTKDGTLTITGTGAMSGFKTVITPQSVIPMSEESLEAAPWSEHSDLITKVVIEDGVTSIGDNAFAACENLAEIEIPETVTSIGDDAFTGCEALETITYAGSEEQWNDIEIGEGNESLEESEIVTTDIWLGDVNGDDRINGTDTDLTFRYVSGTTDLEADCLTRADVNSDGGVTGTDTNLIFRYVSGYVDTLGLYHKYDEGVVTTEPTDTENGEITYTCKLCGATHTRAIPPIGATDAIPTLEVVADTKTAEVGDTVTYKVWLRNADASLFTTGVWNVSFALDLPKGLTLISGSCGMSFDVTTGFLFSGFNAETLIFTSEGALAAGYSGDDLVCMTFTCEVIAAKADLTVTLKDTDLSDNYNAYAANVIGATISVEKTPEGTIASGTCGEKTSWTLSEDGVLTISGEGEMSNFEVVSDLLPQSAVPMNAETAEAAPWSEYTALIAKVIVEDGVTSIGDNAFAACENLTEIEIPETVTEIGDNAFTGCEALETVTYAGSEEQWNDIEIGEGNESLEESEIVTTDILLGDVNGDGKVNGTDTNLIFRHVSGTTELNGDQRKAADVNGDGKVNGTDTNLVFRFVSGVIDSLG